MTYVDKISFYNLYVEHLQIFFWNVKESRIPFVLLCNAIVLKKIWKNSHNLNFHLFKLKNLRICQYLGKQNYGKFVVYLEKTNFSKLSR